MISEDQILAIAQRIVAGYQPDRIILFGSYSYGTPIEDSDLDLLVIKAGIGHKREDRAIAVRRLLRGAGAPMDILVRTPVEVAAAAAISVYGRGPAFSGSSAFLYSNCSFVNRQAQFSA